MKDNSKKKEELHELEVRTLTSENKKLKQNADRSRLELAFIKSQREEDKNLRYPSLLMHNLWDCRCLDDELNKLNWSMCCEDVIYTKPQGLYSRF